MAATVAVWQAPAVERLADQVQREVPQLDGGACALLVHGFNAWLGPALLGRLRRLLVLELHAATAQGRLSGASSEERWQQFVAEAATVEFWRGMERHYPHLRPRVERLIEGRSASLVTMARRLRADRDRLETFAGRGELSGIALGQGDAHRGGHSVMRLEFGTRVVHYKPRPMGVDHALAHLLEDLHRDHEEWIRLPAVITGNGYGWTEHIDHRYCADQAEELRFYRGMGAWMAVMALLGGTDLHHQNMIAAGAVPVIIDCETLFTPPWESKTTWCHAARRADQLVSWTTMASGLLPARVMAGGAVDVSGLGSLPDQQTPVPVPVLQGAGTDAARMVRTPIEVNRPGTNHPRMTPRPEQFVGQIVEGYRAYARRIDALDARGDLEPGLARFGGCLMRLVPRSTQFYVDLEYGLWHPASLHDQGGALKQAERILVQDAERLHVADPDGLARAELADLLAGDVPVFEFAPETGRAHGPGGHLLADYGDQLRPALRRWRSRDDAMHERVIRASLANAYHLHRYTPADAGRSGSVRVLEPDQRRALTARVVARLRDSAIWGDDGTVTWVGTSIGSVTARVVRAVSADLYDGTAGITLALAAYQRAVRLGRADPVSGTDALLEAALATLRAAQQLETGQEQGGYCGPASLVWTWLALDRLRVRRALPCAEAATTKITSAVADQIMPDLLVGAGGAIVPLLGLAERTGKDTYTKLAIQLAEGVRERAVLTKEGATWPDKPPITRPASFPRGSAGFAHGSMGIGWALYRLGLATGLGQWDELAEQAFAFVDSAFQAGRGWRDLRMPSEKGTYTATWCHGTTGVGLAAWDLYRRTGRERFRRMAAHAAELTPALASPGLTLCHGQLGSWELAIRLGVSVDGPAVDWEAEVEALTTPGLMDGLAGVLYQLLQMDSSLALPSPLLLDCGGPQPVAPVGPVHE
ncbi:type 2 lanthipeptide synthetase LanM family protein [Catellatospora sp. NPDC049609]|uniref:type 2 lanthipeptide synthetase LanM family protein n=1 Tax=Catellatospora sp. NPDC049609 TaxID=3155505 RepID=UPI0034193425